MKKLKIFLLLFLLSSLCVAQSFKLSNFELSKTKNSIIKEYTSYVTDYDTLLQLPTWTV